MKDIFKKLIIKILIAESKVVLLKYKPKIVAITGSVGKTSTKDAVFAVLAKSFHVRKTEKSYNSQIGLPLTILGVPNGWNNPITWCKNILKGLFLIVWPHKYPSWLVLEVGVGKPGDMKETALWLKTDAVIVTAIGETPVHIEFFDSRDHLVQEKSELIDTLKKDGILILNADDSTVLDMQKKTRNLTYTYGLSGDPDVKGWSPSILYQKNTGEPEGIIFRIDSKGSSLPVEIEGGFGKNHIYAALASLTLAYGLKLNMIDSSNALKHYSMPPGRMCLLKGLNNSSILDDTYNSSPYACKSALETLGEIKTIGRKIAVLGDMLELGRHTEEAHRNIGKLSKEVADVLVVVGMRAKNIKIGAIEANMNESDIFEFANSTEAGEFLKTFIKAKDVILVKGSQGVRMERAVSMILEDQQNKYSLLARQDKEWLDKK